VKMSKSRGNVVSPDDMVKRYGADSTRLYSLFAAPPDKEMDWQDSGVEGMQRFLGRVYRLVRRHAKPDHPQWRAELSRDGLPPEARAIQRKLHQTIKRVSDDYEGRWHFNTSIAALMELVNELYALEDRGAIQSIPVPLLAEIQRKLILLLHPFAPFLAHELWETLREPADLLRAAWPQYDPALAKEDEIEIVIQVNGKVRSRLMVPAGSPEEVVRERALADEKVRASLNGKQVVKAIVVPGKLVNIVVQ